MTIKLSREKGTNSNKHRQVACKGFTVTKYPQRSSANIYLQLLMFFHSKGWTRACNILIVSNTSFPLDIIRCWQIGSNFVVNKLQHPVRPLKRPKRTVTKLCSIAILGCRIIPRGHSCILPRSLPSKLPIRSSSTLSLTDSAMREFFHIRRQRLWTTSQ